YGVRVVFFFQAEDGIRDRNVTGVQTCALPIFPFWIKHIEDVVKDPSVKWGEGRSFFDNSRLYAISDKHISCLTVNVVMKNLKKLPPAIEKILFSLNYTDLNTTAKSDKLPFKDKTVKIGRPHV